MEEIYKKITKDLLSAKDKTCAEITATTSDIASEHCASFVNEMEGEDKEHPCPCSGDVGGAGGESSDVDLLILSDASGSMSNAMTLIANSLKRAIKAAEKTCKKESDPPLLFVDQVQGGPSSGPANSVQAFSMSHEEFLTTVDGYSGPFRTEQMDSDQGWAAEAGAEAIVDLCNHHKWKEGACRAILYISDTFLDSDTPIANALARSAARMNEAIAAANANQVTIFTHLLPPTSAEVVGADYPALESQYQNLASQTQGLSVTNQPPTSALYEELITEAICRSCANAGGCAEVEWPDVAPCVHVSWGASKCDGIESHDDEVVCITLCNCYSNLTFKNVQIGYIAIVDKDGNLPPLLPDGSPSAHIYPMGSVCFGDIGPCVDGQETCVSRQFVILTRGAMAGEYRLKIGGLCFEICNDVLIDDIERTFKICKD